MNLLFDIEKQTPPKINGLSYQENFITAEEEGELLKYINERPWETEFKRWVQHYGYHYDYRARIVEPQGYIGPLPMWMQAVAQRLAWSNGPDQCLVNKYEPGQGIAAHIDCEPCFGDRIASLSLGSGATMQFTKGDQKEELYLEPQSLLTLSVCARYEWKHGIPPRKSDILNGFKVSRQRRVSLTFRTVILD